eukprot:5973034-Pleurochrysis_carterae.AAC.1
MRARHRPHSWSRPGKSCSRLAASARLALPVPASGCVTGYSIAYRSSGTSSHNPTYLGSRLKMRGKK